MFPIRKIIAPTDFSDASQEGLKAAIEAAEKFAAELIVVHVNVRPLISGAYSKPDIQSKVDLLMNSMQTEVRRHLDEMLAGLIPGNLRCQVRLIEGQPAHEIVHLAKQEGADLIVMATHGHSGFNRLMTGSVAEKVVRTAHCPVLTIRPKQRE
ncbi:MAG: universal stress protein [Desulfobacterales bacterium]|nr:universal stress protein [Desulfobacterales bacterium]